MSADALSSLVPQPPFDHEDPSIKHEILMMILQYLEENGFRSSALVLRNEARFQSPEEPSQATDLTGVHHIVSSGSLAQLEAIQLPKVVPPRLVYTIYRHRFLDLLLSGDTHSALPYLSSRLRPFRAFEDQPGDFNQLCFLLVDCASPSRSLALPDLEISRQKTLAAIEAHIASSSIPSGDRAIPNGRLSHLMQQAAAYQLTKYPLGQISSIMSDFIPAVVPKVTDRILSGGHTTNIKAIAFVPRRGLLLSGGSDSSLVVWDVDRMHIVKRLTGHGSRIWDVSARERVAVSGSGDGTIRIWDLTKYELASIISGHNRDVYSVNLDATGSKIVSGGFDCQLRIWDVTNPQSPIQTIAEHKGAVTSVCFDSSGNLAVSGGKDLRLCIWDLRSGVCVQSLSPVLAEVSSVCADQSFTRILTATKNDTNRIWDLRTARPALCLKGHQNCLKSFVRAGFGPAERTVIGGSEDGRACCWDVDSGILVERTAAHQDGVFEIVHSEEMHLFASCGGNEVIRIWAEKQME
jgi:WD40 repeat protein